MIEYYIIAGFVAGVDRVAWAIWGRIWRLVPPKPWEPWVHAVFSAIGGAVGALAITQLTRQNDLFTIVVGAIIGGRIVGGILDTMAAPRAADAPRQ
jgi:hypothetical protein